MSRPYRPTSGTEGEAFQFAFCSHCKQDSETKSCRILVRTMAFNITDVNYPKEWIIGLHGPTCTAFEARNNDKE